MRQLTRSTIPRPGKSFDLIVERAPLEALQFGKDRRATGSVRSREASESSGLQGQVRRQEQTAKFG